MVARKGEKKSAALKPLLQAIEKIEEEEQREWELNHSSSTPGAVVKWVGKKKFFLVVRMFHWLDACDR